jgi:voltage-gated potassium channel
MARLRSKPPRSWCALARFEHAIEPAVQWLAVAWLLVVVLELVRGRSPGLDAVGTALWIFFAVDVAIRFFLAPKKLRFLRRNWLTILATIVPVLRLVRTVRVIRLLRFARWSRLVRVAGTVNRSATALRATIARRRIAYATSVTIVVWIVGSAAMVAFERDGQPEVLGNVGTGLWWTAMLLATMGTEHWPKTTEGRILSFVLAVYGVAVFGYITAALATLFMAQVPERSAKDSSASAS